LTTLEKVDLADENENSEGFVRELYVLLHDFYKFPKREVMERLDLVISNFNTLSASENKADYLDNIGKVLDKCEIRKYPIHNQKLNYIGLEIFGEKDWLNQLIRY